MKILIPIKEVSERVSKKNFRDFHGQPLWLRCVNKFSDFEIYIDTDSEEIVSFYECGELPSNVTVYKRDESLLGHDTSMNKIIKFFIDHHCNDDDVIVQIHATNPFLEVKTVQEAFDRLIHKTWYDSVVSCDTHRARGWRVEERGPQQFVPIPINHNPDILEKTQDLEPIFIENSCFYGFTPSSFRNNGNNRMGKKPLFMNINFPESIDIDDEKDWNLAIKIGEVLK